MLENESSKFLSSLCITLDTQKKISSILSLDLIVTSLENAILHKERTGSGRAVQVVSLKPSTSGEDLITFKVEEIDKRYMQCAISQCGGNFRAIEKLVQSLKKNYTIRPSKDSIDSALSYVVSFFSGKYGGSIPDEIVLAALRSGTYNSTDVIYNGLSFDQLVGLGKNITTILTVGYYFNSLPLRSRPFLSIVMLKAYASSLKGRLKVWQQCLISMLKLTGELQGVNFEIFHYHWEAMVLDIYREEKKSGISLKEIYNCDPILTTNQHLWNEVRFTEFCNIEIGYSFSRD
jgi:hypothetical protein